VHDNERNARTARPARGRPRKEADKRRTRRIVTFVTEAECAQLQQLVLTSDRSLSFVVHRMIAEQLKASEPGERGCEEGG
jgi:hypothetical protein